MASLLRTMGGLGVVLGVLAAALWIVRRYDLRLPGRSVSVGDRRLELIETLSIDARRSVALIRRDGCEHVILIAPDGQLVLETAITRDPAELAAVEERRRADAEEKTRRAEQRAWEAELRASANKAAFERVIGTLKGLCASFAQVMQVGQARALPIAKAGLAALQNSSTMLVATFRGRARILATASRDRVHMLAVASRARARVVAPALQSRARLLAAAARHRAHMLATASRDRARNLTTALQSRVRTIAEARRLPVRHIIVRAAEPPPTLFPAARQKPSPCAYARPDTKRARRRRRTQREKQVA